MNELSRLVRSTELSDVVKTTVYVATTTRGELLEVWQCVREHFGEHDPPSTLLGVTVLGYRDQLVEIEALAALPTESASWREDGVQP